MKTRSTALLALGLLLGIATPLLADEPEAELKFIDELVARGYPDLALEYMETKLSPQVQAKLGSALVLEKAKCRVATAAQEVDEAKRADAYAKARQDFETFLKSNAMDPRAADANLELGRLNTEEGKLRLRNKEYDKARAAFDAADAGLKNGVTQLDDQFKKADAKTEDGKALQRNLLQAKRQAAYERALSAFYKALTFHTNEEGVQRGNQIEKEAISQFDKIIADADSPFHWQAQAWLVTCYDEIDRKKEAKQAYAKVMNTATGPGADAGKRLALYFYMRFLKNDRDTKDPPGEIIKIGRQWQTTYRNFLNTPEGCGVRFQLADAYFDRATAAYDKNKKSLEARQDFKEARELYAALEYPTNEYSTRAREQKLRVIVVMTQKQDPKTLNNFEDCHVQAQLQAALMSEDQKELEKVRKEAKDPDDVKKKAAEVEKQRQEHFRTMIESLERALALPPEVQGTPQQQAECREMLAYAYLAQGDLYRAVVFAEDLARTEPRSETASAAAAYALDAYSQIVAKDQAALAAPDVQEAKDDDPVKRGLKAQLDADRNRLRKLAQMMEQKWPNNPATDTARFQMADLLLREKNYQDAIVLLGRIANTFGNYNYARYQLALAAEQMSREETKNDGSKLTDADKAAYQKQAIDTLVAIKDSNDPYSAMVYVLAQVDLARIYFYDKKYKEVLDLAMTLEKVLDNPKFDKTRDELRPRVDTLVLYAKYARARSADEAGDFAEVLKLVEPEITKLDSQVDKQTGKLPEFTDVERRSLVRALLGIALRAYVQQKNLPQAKKVLELAQKTAGEGEPITAVLLPVVGQLRKQMDDLRGKKDIASQQKLKDFQQSFETFLDELAKQPALSLEIHLFLAQSYASLDQHAKAADMLRRKQVPAPTEDPKPEPGKEKDAAFEKRVSDNQLARAARLMLGQELRLAKKLDDAEKILKEVKDSTWGKQNLQVHREWILLLQDKGNFAGKGGAIREWDTLMKAIQPRIADKATRNDFKEFYYECYFHLTECFVLNATKNISDPAKRKPWIERAAKFMVDLGSIEDKWGTAATKARFVELVKQEPALLEELRKQAPAVADDLLAPKADSEKK
jgi:hypothetical protein